MFNRTPRLELDEGGLNSMAVQPNHITIWDEFTARQTRETGEVGSTAATPASQGILALGPADAGDPCSPAHAVDASHGRSAFAR
jgi:hypothetical protein